MRRRVVKFALGALALLACLGTAAGAAPARPAMAAAAPHAVPRDCTPVRVANLRIGVAACVDGLTVVRTVATAEQNRSTFTARDDAGQALEAFVPRWWPSGGPVAGMTVTLWGASTAQGFRVDRWVEHNHGPGPSPQGPYPRRRLVDIAAGKYPALEMAWVIAIPFALDPQDTGDQDTHVQTFLPCPAGGLTFETTPPLRGYIDHPNFNPALETTNQADRPSAHVAEDPPLGVPVMMLGQLRVDFGFGWWEVHPIRAWRFLTSDEAAHLGDECANAPVPVLDRTGPDGLPLPLGVPPCTDGSEVGNPGGIYKPCGSHCYVATTEIGRPPTYAGHCAGVTLSTSGGSASPPPGPGNSPGSRPAGVTGASGQLPPTTGDPSGLGSWAAGLLALAAVCGVGLVITGWGGGLDRRP